VILKSYFLVEYLCLKTAVQNLVSAFQWTLEVVYSSQYLLPEASMILLTNYNDHI